MLHAQCARGLQGVELPSSLRHLNFGLDFNQSLDLKQSELEGLKLGSRYHQRLQLPMTLRSLSFESFICRSLDGMEQLQHLDLTGYFNQPFGTGDDLERPLQLPPNLTLGAISCDFCRLEEILKPRGVLQPELEARSSARHLGELDLWQCLQSEPVQRGLAQKPSPLSLWQQLLGVTSL